ncbi:tetratricopeptide repeat protein [Granulicella sp. dw_53]|uniref:tetratricopeptide repeat protein n=1 Tax=Granulicella sp. dw_53 TaxID=2719792 RepID=UPI002103A3C5|nr:tetratricopeptide repeat protein [Granulicella sp. dw_53]
MKYFLRTFFGFALATYSTALLGQHHHHGAEGGDPNAAVEKFGSIHMPISCTASVQAPFERGVALLHSFWYEEAEKQFQAVAIADSKCAMAEWGLAMAQYRPFWDGMPEDRRKIGIVDIDKATALNAKTDRERRYIAALSAYMHADPSQNEKAVHAYASAMGALHNAYPDDVEGTAFYGLALAASIGTQDPVGDARKALAVLEPGFQAHPDHPGFAHYIIHTCDSPQLAREALPAAERYAAIAPSSAHALHMPGHIFARLGMWQEDIDSDEASVRASELAEKNHQAGVTHELHAYEFLLYAYLQQGDDANAKRILDIAEPMAAHLRSMPDLANDGMAHYLTYAQVEFPSIYYLEMHDWKAVLSIPEPPNSIPSAKYFRFWAQAIAAGRLRDADAADKAAAAAGQIAAEAEKEGSPIGAEIATTQATIKAWQSFAHKQDEQALQQIAAAADIQDRVGQAEVDIPAREMYADMLFIDNRPVEALEQYRTALKLSPNRFNALYNAGRAAEAAGKPEEALNYFTQLMKVTGGGERTQRPEVFTAKSFLHKEQADGSSTPMVPAEQISTRAINLVSAQAYHF